MKTEMQKKDFEIRFKKSSSDRYLDAIKIAKKFSDFTPANDTCVENIIKIGSEEIFVKYKIFEKLYEIIGGWRSTISTYKGLKIQPKKFFQQLNVITHCAKEYEASTTKETHCNRNGKHEEGWGCYFLKRIKRHPGYLYSTYWYEFGNFESEKGWKIDKNAIKEELKNEADCERLEHCPIFSIDRVFESVDNLPDIIDLNDTESWEIEYVDDFLGSTIQKRAVGIRHVIKEEEAKVVDPMPFFSLLGLAPKTGHAQDAADDKKRYIPDTTFDDVGGIDHIIGQIREVIELPLKQPELLAHLGIKPHKGILLYGDSGNGKTLIAKAIANEIKAHFIPIGGSELISKYIGQSEENLRRVFKEARELKPSIIFFDEIDSVARKRSGEESGRHDSQFVNQLLTLMDGVESYDGVTVLASTNRPDILDEALLRPGRFDYKIEIKNPDGIGCYKILKIATKEMPLADDANIYEISPLTVGCSGAEINFIAKEAALNALRRTVDLRNLVAGDNPEEVNLDSIRVTREDFMDAIETHRENQVSGELAYID